MRTRWVASGRGNVREAAANGDLQVLKYARENGCPWDSSVCSNAAHNGCLDMLKYAQSRTDALGTAEHALTLAVTVTYIYSSMLERTDCPWNIRTPLEAAAHGHLHILKYTRENGFPNSAEVSLSPLLMVTYTYSSMLGRMGTSVDPTCAL